MKYAFKYFLMLTKTVLPHASNKGENQPGPISAIVIDCLDHVSSSFEQRHEKINVLHMQKQRRRSASR